MKFRPDQARTAQEAARPWPLLFAGLAVAATVTVAVVFWWQTAPVVPVARVGAYTIDQEALALRAKQINLSTPQKDPELAAFAQLLQGYLSATIAETLGRPMGSAPLRREYRRIQNQTRDPARWASIEAIYDGQPDRLLRVGILPDFARSSLYSWFVREGNEPHAYDAWFWPRAATVDVEVFRPALAKRFQERVGWARHVRFVEKGS